MSSKPIDANNFVFFPDLMIAALKGLERGATVTRYHHEAPRADIAVEFEVRITKLNGKSLPRATEGMATRTKGKS